jgi:hypothetical protein
MDRQRKYQLLFGICVRGIGAVRYARASAPIVAGMALCVAGFTANHLPQPELSVDSRLGGIDVAADLQGNPTLPEAVAGTMMQPQKARLPDTARVSGPVLSREQQNVVKFIAKTYQVAAEQTQWFVEHAYRTARDLKIDPMLILAVISVESSFDPRAQSHRGAQGLMQVLTRVHADKFSPFGGAAAAFDPMANIRVGAQILNDYLKRDGSVEGALKAYVGAALLPSDGGYGARVIFERERMAAAAAGRPVPVVRPVQESSNQPEPSGMRTVSMSEPGADMGRTEHRMVTDSPLLVPPPAPSVEVGAPEAATPAKPASRDSSDA